MLELLYYVFNGWSRMVDGLGDRPHFCYTVACDIPLFLPCYMTIIYNE